MQFLVEKIIKNFLREISNLRYNSILSFEQNMGSMAEGQVYTCSECGLELKVTKPCDEEDCDLICCSKQMNQS